METFISIPDNVRISEVAEHSLLRSVGIKSLKLTDLHLCDGQTRWGRGQLHTENTFINVSVQQQKTNIIVF